MRIAAVGITLDFDPTLGIIERFEAGGIAPLHRAPWVDREEIPAGPTHISRGLAEIFSARHLQRERGHRQTTAGLPILHGMRGLGPLRSWRLCSGVFSVPN